MSRFVSLFALAAFVGSAAGCSSTSTVEQAPKTDAEYKADVVANMHSSLLKDIDDLLQAAKDLQAAAPTTAGRGWDPAEDAASIAAMKAAWIRARTAYEHVEGALAPIFPDLDASIDARYDDFLSQLANQNDVNLFDDQGVTGLHAVERILYSDTTPASVVAFEMTLTGYKASAFPATEQESADFKNKLCAKIIADAQTFHEQWTPAKIDIGGAFQGLISLMNEQREKVNKASTFEEESRYSQRTMADLRENLAGTKAIYALFQPWLVAKSNPMDAAKSGSKDDQSIAAGFAAVDALYAQVQGDAIPQPPASWMAENPSATDLMSPFGVLYTGVKAAVDPGRDGSVVESMNSAATILGFPEFVEGQLT